MTSQSRNNETWSGGGGGLTGISLAPTVQTGDTYTGVYIDAATVELKTATEELKDHVQQLKSDMEFLRSIITELYNKCPKAMVNMSKKKKKEDTVECESCGGLLW